jgi:glycyl-tRNA synthetase beta chain
VSELIGDLLEDGRSISDGIEGLAGDLVFEIGVEEIPSAALYGAVSQLASLAAAALKDARLGYGEMRVAGSPRRLVLVVEGLAEKQDDLDMRVKGPSVRAAFDGDGNPTPAVIGFARGKGVEVSALERGQDAGGEYVYAHLRSDGLPAAAVLPELLSRLVGAIEWPKSQRWGSGGARFIRPVRWLLALLDADVVPATFAGVTAGRVTFGHRFLSAGAISVPMAADLAIAHERGKVIADAEARAQLIREGIDGVAAQEGLVAVVPEKVFAEVVNLVEYPTVAVARFDEAFLRVPREVLETAMESHQRYFPLQDAAGGLSNAFIVVHNGDPARTDAIVRGHERVIRARLADAAFFYDEDLAVGMEPWVERLSTAVFQERLGTLAAKVERVEALTSALAELHGAGPGEGAAAVRAAHLSKADLVSHMVVEFPSLQGVMGRYYALSSGEAPAVADAILEHYLPRFAGDVLPASVPGLLLSAADKLDTVCGIFALGQAPTGSADPFALRRAAIGILAMVLDGGLRLRLGEAVSAALAGYEGVVPFDRDETAASVQAFMAGRLETMLRDRGLAYDTVDAVLAVAGDDPADALARARALEAARAAEGMADLAVAFARAKNLSDTSAGGSYDRSLMGASESALADAIEAAESRVGAAVAATDYEGALAMLAGLRAPIDAFFTGVLVMDADERLRTMRLALLNRFTALFEGLADFSRLAG